MEIPSDIAAKRYATIFAIPIAMVIAAGVIEPVVEGFFVLASVLITVLVVVALVFHERLFSLMGADDPIPESALSGYLLSATSLFAFSIALLSFDRTLLPITSLDTDHYLLPHISVSLLNGQVSSILLWLAVFPIAGVISFRYLKNRRQLVRSSAVIVSTLLIGTLCLLAARNQFDYTVIPLSFQTLTLLHLLILFLSGLVAVAVFFVVLRISASTLTKLHQDFHAWLLLPTGMGVADLVTIVQGFSGLHEHYVFLDGIAFGGMVALILSLLSGLAFGAMCVLRGQLSRHHMPHYLLAFSMSLFLGCVVMFALSEAGGFWFESLR